MRHLGDAVLYDVLSQFLSVRLARQQGDSDATCWVPASLGRRAQRPRRSYDANA